MDIVFWSHYIASAMPSPRLIPCLLGIVLALASSHVTIAAITKEDREVQTLANFPALQKLAARNDGKLRAYLSRVSDSYRRVGYGQFARELGQSASLVILFGQPERADIPSVLKKARTALRDLEQALAKNRFVILPRTKGETMPDFYHIGSAFLDAAGIALKNLAAHENVANTLRNNQGSLWLTNKGSNDFTATFSFGGFVIQTISFAVQNTATTATNLSTWLNLTSYDSSSLVVSGSFSGAVMLTAVGYPKNVAFPPNVDLPLDVNYTLTSTLTEPQIINDIEFPIGTRIIGLPADFVIPPGAHEIPIAFSAFHGVNSNAEAFGTGNVAFASTAPIGYYRLTGASATLKAADSGRWLAFPPEVAAPSLPNLQLLLLGRAYLAGGINLPTGTRIAFIGNQYSDPNGAITLPAGDCVLTPVLFFVSVR